MRYRVSFVVPDGTHKGGIQDLDHEPKVGDVFRLGDHEFEIIEVSELVPPRGEYAYLHATCRPVAEESTAE